MLYLGKALYDEAITNLQQSLKLKPDLTDAQIWLSESYEAIGLHDKAVEVYEEALKLDPAAEEVQEKLKYLKERLKDLKATRTPEAPASRR